METKELNKTVIEKAESIESKYHINYIASGLPRWLIEVAFLCFLLQAVINWTPLMHWMEDHAPLASAIIQTFGALVMYVGLMRGMKPLYRPMTLGWWIVIALNIAGFIPLLFPVLMESVGLPIAVSLMQRRLSLSRSLWRPKSPNRKKAQMRTIMVLPYLLIRMGWNPLQRQAVRMK